MTIKLQDIYGLTKADLLPAGGAQGQVLAKKDAVTGNVEWAAPLPLGGDEADVLIKDSDTDGDVVWHKPAANHNMIINGDFSVWQRGPDGTGPGTGIGAGYVCADRWWMMLDIRGEKLELDPVKAENCLKLSHTKAGGGTRLHILHGVELRGSGIENGGTYTFSADFNATENFDAVFRVRYRDAVGQPTNEVEVFPETVIEAGVAANAWKRIKQTFTINLDPASTNKSMELRIGALRSAGGNWAQNTGQLKLRRVKLEVGDKATPFVPRLFGEELALCLRYYQTILGGKDCYIAGIGATNTTYYQLPVKMRARPTIVRTYAGSGPRNIFDNTFPKLAVIGGGTATVALLLAAKATGRTTISGAAWSLDAEL